MKGSEYIAARAGIGAACLIVGGAVVAVTALWIVPLALVGLAAVLPGVLPPLGGLLIGLALVIAVAVLMQRFLRYSLARLEKWVIDHGGIED